MCPVFVWTAAGGSLSADRYPEIFNRFEISNDRSQLAQLPRLLPSKTGNATTQIGFRAALELKGEKASSSVSHLGVRDTFQLG